MVGNEERTQCAQSLNILASDSIKLRKVGRQLKTLFVYFFSKVVFHFYFTASALSINQGICNQGCKCV